MQPHAQQGRGPRLSGRRARVSPSTYIRVVTNIYLDIDGVLLNGDEAAIGAADFIQFVTASFPHSVYWLSGRCSGDAEATVNQIARYFDAGTVELLRAVCATEWPLVKSQAVDFAFPFLWFDDVLEFADEDELISHGAIQGLVLVDLVEEPDQLLSILANFPRPRARRA